MKFLERFKQLNRMSFFNKNLGKPQRYTAFTLAEVLITLGIIGVVAALTIPALINTVQDMQYKTAYKKAFAVIAQAVDKVNSENGFIDATSYLPRPSDFDKNFLAIMNEFTVVKSCVSNNNSECWDSNGEKDYDGGTWWPASSGGYNGYAFIDSSGMAWSQFWSGDNSVFVDTNGFKAPNQWGKDRFFIYLLNSENSQTGLPIKVRPRGDNPSSLCLPPNKCATSHDYYGAGWLLNK